MCAGEAVWVHTMKCGDGTFTQVRQCGSIQVWDLSMCAGEAVQVYTSVGPEHVRWVRQCRFIQAWDTSMCMRRPVRQQG